MEDRWNMSAMEMIEHCIVICVNRVSVVAKSVLYSAEEDEVTEG